jgi:hypothetical protein
MWITLLLNPGFSGAFVASTSPFLSCMCDCLVPLLPKEASYAVSSCPAFSLYISYLVFSKDLLDPKTKLPSGASRKAAFSVPRSFAFTHEGYSGL